MLNDDWKYDEPRKVYCFNEEEMAEYDNQIRADAIDEFVELYEKFCKSDIACGALDCVGKFCPRCFRDNFMKQLKEECDGR